MRYLVTHIIENLLLGSPSVSDDDVLCALSVAAFMAPQPKA